MSPPLKKGGELQRSRKKKKRKTTKKNLVWQRIWRRYFAI